MLSDISLCLLVSYGVKYTPSSHTLTLTHVLPSCTLLLTCAHLPPPPPPPPPLPTYHLSAEFLQEHRHVLEARLQPIVREIADTRARSREELESE